MMITITWDWGHCG